MRREELLVAEELLPPPPPPLLVSDPGRRGDLTGVVLTLAVETCSDGRDSGTVGRVVLIPADMLYDNQQFKNQFSAVQTSSN